MLENLTTVTEPSIEPVTVAELKTHARLDSSNQYPAPAALTAALAGDGAGNVDDGAHRYKVTFVTADGETDGGDASAAVTVSDNTSDGQVDLSDIPLGGSAVTSRKIYRTEAGGSTYYLLTTIADNSTTTYTDNIADSSLGAEVPSTNTTEDPILSSLIKAARQQAEALTERSLITQTLKLTLSAFPGSRNIYLPRPNLQSVTSITYTDAEGSGQTLSTDAYDVQTGWPAVISLADGYSWPTVKKTLGAVEITYVAGYGDARSDIPEEIRVAIQVLATTWYNNRDSLIIGTNASEVPMMAKYMLAPYRVALG